MARDWRAWYAGYDDATSSLSRRLRVVQEQLATVLAARPGPLRLISICAGDGRDTLPVLAEQGTTVDALLVELDPDLAARARVAARDLGLGRVVVRTTDAGTTAAYEDFVPADVLLACGVFGNVTDDDVRRTVAALPSLLSSDGVVIWTRGHRVPLDPTLVEGDPSDRVRALFTETGFDELEFIRPDDAGFRVGVHRLARAPESYSGGVRLFSFV